MSSTIDGGKSELCGPSSPDDQATSAAHLSFSDHSLSASIQHLIGAELATVEATLQASLSSEYAEVDHLCAQAAAMGGKRLRPMLVLLSAKTVDRGASQRESERDRCRIAAAVELVHAASLVHDDVMDDATQRRHLPTIGRLAGQHAAILLGDYLFTKGYGLAAQCRRSIPAQWLAKASSALCEGELRQQLMAGHWDMPLSQYRSILMQKTGALCGTSCRLGGWAAGADRDTQRALNHFGRRLGLAFQVFDDWLDYWGTASTGKTLGTDLQQGKPTLPVLRMLAQSQPARRRQLLEWLTRGTHEDEIREQLNASDASQYTLRVARSCVDGALQALGQLPSSDSRRCLVEIAKFSIARAA